MDGQVILCLDGLKQIDIAGNQRALADQADRHSALAAQPLQHRPGNPEGALRRLVGIGRGTDHHGLDARGPSPTGDSQQVTLQSGKYRVSPFYDSLIAKVIVHARTRDLAIARMKRALEMMVIEGIKTTIPLHQKIMDDPKFRRGEIGTDFMEYFLARNGKVGVQRA